MAIPTEAISAALHRKAHPDIVPSRVAAPAWTSDARGDAALITGTTQLSRYQLARVLEKSVMTGSDPQRRNS
jgi:hypothetical protein